MILLLASCVIPCPGNRIIDIDLSETLEVTVGRRAVVGTIEGAANGGSTVCYTVCDMWWATIGITPFGDAHSPYTLPYTLPNDDFAWVVVEVDASAPPSETSECVVYSGGERQWITVVSE